MNQKLFNQSIIFNLIIPIIFFTLASLILPLDQVFQFDTDEGIQLVKAQIYNQGMAFSPDFWNDQPLLFTIILAKWLNFVPNNIVNARLLSIGFTTLLIWAFANILRLCVSDVTAIIGTFLLILSGNFLRLTGSVMIGIPSIALAVVSIYTIILYSQKNRLYLLLISALSFSLSLQIKFFTIFLLPIMITFLVISQRHKGKYFKDFSIWLSSFTIIFLISILTNIISIEDVFRFHIESNLQEYFTEKNSLVDVLVIYLRDLDYLLLGIIGIKTIKLDLKQNLINYIPLIWLGLITILLLNHKPVWYHHGLLITIPLTWLVSYQIDKLLPYFNGKKWYFTIDVSRMRRDGISKVTIAFLILCLVGIPIKTGIIISNNNIFIKKSQSHFEVVKRILTYKNETNWLFTDNPIYSYYSQIKIPPEIAVLSRKRIASGSLNQEKLEAILTKYQPEQVILWRFKEIEKEILPYLQKHYQSIFQGHYLINSGLHKPKGNK